MNINEKEQALLQLGTAFYSPNAWKMTPVTDGKNGSKKWESKDASRICTDVHRFYLDVMTVAGGQWRSSVLLVSEKQFETIFYIVSPSNPRISIIDYLRGSLGIFIDRIPFEFPLKDVAILLDKEKSLKQIIPRQSDNSLLYPYSVAYLVGI